MRVTKEILTCDICKSETDELLRVILPYEAYIDTSVATLVSYKPSGEYRTMPLEVCQKCAKRITDKISEVVTIELIPYMGVEITDKEKESDE